MSANGDDPAKRRKPAIAAARGKDLTKGLAELAAGLDKFCARMNAGLCAVALVLGFALLISLSIRMPAMNYYAPEVRTASDAAAPSD